MSKRGVRVAFEGCGHGTLNSIYASVEQSCKIRGWSGIDLLIIGGDFEALRNAHDLNSMAVPLKYREMGDFWQYYSGERKAPYLTLFIGGNHEASNYLSELFYGGWVAPNIYYLGAANVVRFGPLRIAGLSGIWKGYNYKKPHFERLPYSQGDIRSIYHVREIDTRKLLQISSPIDIGLSHDWPRGVEWKGNWKALFARHGHLEPDAREGVLGNVAAEKVLNRLRPRYWFSAHLHVKFAAVINHNTSDSAGRSVQSPANGAVDHLLNPDEIDIDIIDEKTEPMQDEVHETVSTVPVEQVANASAVSQALRDRLPASFQKRDKITKSEDAPVPQAITNCQTQFLALDKCLPGRNFLQLLEINASCETSEHEQSYEFLYDEEWMAINRVFGADLIFGDPSAYVPADKGYEFYQSRIKLETEWVRENLVKNGRMVVPKNFQRTAPIYDATMKPSNSDQGKEYTNTQTAEYCQMLNIPNPFDISEAERNQRLARGPVAVGDGGHGSRGAYSHGGRGHGQRGRGRGRWHNRGFHGAK